MDYYQLEKENRKNLGTIKRLYTKVALQMAEEFFQGGIRENMASDWQRYFLDKAGKYMIRFHYQDQANLKETVLYSLDTDLNYMNTIQRMIDDNGRHSYGVEEYKEAFPPRLVYEFSDLTAH